MLFNAVHSVIYRLQAVIENEGCHIEQGLPHAPTIIHYFIELRMTETIANTNETFRKIFPSGIPFYFRPNFYNSQFISYHDNYGEFLAKIGATDDPSCFCGKENQNLIH
ncbi:hypothetical protein LAZ67_6003447 [Cordylochernes scorpioides]|uniref:Uncharacterized protein n=1 Tax=Cordylochernes scorpioides TaxID=51811 RepID=A0ABY6KM11_9ARAC|nr:hypothetical protein LAZ67_6003447 [Cordylochernes scorpioides]